tara:strand:- start:10964 stop:11905 length:942 start_codon:yes stop_codon:yes gene_type:complete
MSINKKIYVTGHNGLVGSACLRILKKQGYNNLIYSNSSELDLRDKNKVFNFLSDERPDIIINAAAKVGGILANKNNPYQFLMDNMQIQNNLIDASFKLEIPKFIFLGSSCIYPKLAKQPLKEEYLLTGPLEPTNEWYAIAKISGVKLIESLNKQYGKSYVALMPTNLYGPNDNFDLETSHVLPAMLRKFHEAKINHNPNVKLWGTGQPLREFLHVDDLAKAIIFSINNDLPGHLYNVGTGIDISIKRLAETIRDIVGFQGDIIWDSDKPDGTPRKLMDVTRLHSMGWKHSHDLEDGIINLYHWFLKNYSKIRG